METLAANCKEFGVRLYDLNHKYQGIVHVMGPELGITPPGTTIVCGDSPPPPTAPSAPWRSVSAPPRCWST